MNQTAEKQDLKEKLLHHPLYAMMKTKEDILLFMETHVFAVWDFMSLLKSLQRDLTCTTTPWLPKSSATTRFFINEIVLGEESDVDPEGGYISHFELYLKAMRQSGANTNKMEAFIELIQHNTPIPDALEKSHVPIEAQEFVKATFEQIETKSIHERAALFTYGREDLIPGMFLTLVETLKNEGAQLDTFIYYLKRHIELDGDHHGALSSQMTAELVNNDPLKQAEVEAMIAWGYQQRIALWDGIAKRIQQRSTELN
jgi:hypothetical protein